MYEQGGHPEQHSDAPDHWHAQGAEYAQNAKANRRDERPI